MSYYRVEHTPDNDPELAYTVVHDGDEAVEEVAYLTRLQATRIALGVNLLMKLVEIGPQRELPYGALRDANGRDNLDRSADQQAACEDAIARYADILSRPEEHNAATS